MTVRLDGSLPRAQIEELKNRKKAEEKLLREKGLSDVLIDKALHKCSNLYFGKFDKLLDSNSTGPHWLKEDQVAKIWSDALFHFDGDRYSVICSIIMSNHVHFIFYRLDRALSLIMKSIKGFSGRLANKVLNREGNRFWQIESYDRVIRDRKELGHCINYTLNNPVKAGNVNHWKDYKHSYIHPDFLKFVDEV